MSLCLLGYLVRIWERAYRRDSQNSLPIILPVVLSHDPQGWKGPTRLWDMLDPNPADLPALAQLVPDFSFVLEDLSTRSDTDIRGFALPPFPMLSIWLMRDGRTGSRLRATLPKWGDDK